MVHRDLKPDNIFLAMVNDTGMVPKVLDFGIVKLREGIDVPFGSSTQSTQTGAVLGTPFYMAFEQAMGSRDVDHRADVWSLGVIVYEALSGRRPLVFNTFGEMYHAFLTAEIAPIQRLAPALPTKAAEVVDAMVRVNRDERVDGLAPLISMLEALVTDASFSTAILSPHAARAERSGPLQVPETPLSMVGGASTAHDEAPARSSARSWALLALAMALVGGAAGTMRLVSGGPVASVTRMPLAYEVDVPRPGGTSETAPENEAVSDDEQHDEPHPPALEAKTTPTPATPRTAPRARPSEETPAPAASAACTPPYTIGPDGVKRYKADCFLGERDQ
jgi:serine/threonine-protein kinase